MNEYSKVRNATDRARILARAMLAAATIVGGPMSVTGTREHQAWNDYEYFRDELRKLLDEARPAEP